MEISVDDLEDRIADGWAAGGWPPVPAAAGSKCTLRPAGSLSSAGGDAGPGNCTLRGALLLANAVAAEETGPRSTLTLLLRGGAVRLAAPLPEITGSVVLQGAIGRSARDAATAGAETDPYFSPAASAGQSAPIGSVIDGQEAFQILRVGRGARLALRSVRLERGRALEDTAGGAGLGAGPSGGGAAPELERRAWAARAVAGGTVNSLGILEMDNVAVRLCAARDGGAVYAEGFFVTKECELQSPGARVRLGLGFNLTLTQT